MTVAARWRPVAVATAIAFGFTAIGGLLTDIGPWYLGLRQPDWKPPDWAFGPIWTILFILCATAGVIGWRRAPDDACRHGVVWRFLLNGTLNALWSLLYFRLQRPDWALIEVPFLWLSIVVLIVFLARFAKPAAWLLAPYLVWVSIAAALNWQGVELNGPFAPK